MAIAEVLQKSNIRLGLEFLGSGVLPIEREVAAHVHLHAARDRRAGRGVRSRTSASCSTPGTGITRAGRRPKSSPPARSRIVHVHVSDAKPAPPEEVRDNQRHMPGEGVIDLVGFFQALKKIGYVDGVSPEPLGRVPADMPAEEGARLGLETTLAVMKKAGL